MILPPEEALCAEGLVCFPGSNGLLHLSRGVRVHAPERRAATNRLSNHLCASLAQAMSLLREGQTLQWQWCLRRGPEPRVQGYVRATPAGAPGAVQRYRNHKAIRFLRALDGGLLRGEEVTLWMGQDVSYAKPTRDDRTDLSLFYGRLLTEMAAETAKLFRSLEAVLAPAGLRLESVPAQGVYHDWHRTLNPSAGFRRRALTVPAEPVFSLTEWCWLSELCGLGSHGFVLDGEYYAILVLRGLPGLTYPGILDPLTTLLIRDLSITVLVRRLARQALLAQLEARLQKVQQQLRRPGQPRLEVTAAQLQEKLAQLARGAIVPLEYKLIVVLHAPTPAALRHQTDLVKGAGARMNLPWFEARLAATTRDLFLLTLPGRLHGEEACFAHYGESDYLAPLLPLPNCFEAFTDQAQVLFEGPYHNLIGVRTCVGEGPARMPQHCLISGQTGSGKSYFATSLELETAPFFDFTWILDCGGSHRPLVAAVGGTSLTITRDCPWTFNPFSTDGAPDSSSHRAWVTALTAAMAELTGQDDEAQDKRALLAKHVAAVSRDFAEAWLRRQTQTERLRVARQALAMHRLAGERLCEPLEAFLALRDDLQAGSESARQRVAAPPDAEVRAFATHHREVLRDLVFAHLPHYPTLSALREHLEMAGASDPRCARLADRVRPFCLGGAYGKLFDGQSNATLTSLTSRTTHLELGRLDRSDAKLKSLLWVLLLHLLCQQCLRRPVAETKRIVLEEISELMTLPGAADMLRSMLATFRKLNVQVTLICQQISQLQDEDLRRVLLGNMRMAFLFQPGSPRDLDLLAEHLPLSDAAKAMILKYVTPDQLRGSLFSECCYLHLTDGEPHCGTIRFLATPEMETKPS